MPKAYIQDDVRGTNPIIDLIPIDVSAADYTPTDYPSFRGFVVGTAGIVNMVCLNGETRVIPANCLAVGVFHPIAGKQILTATTTATEICVGF